MFKHKLAKLYFKYIQRSILERLDYSPLQLGKILEEWKFIQVDNDKIHFYELKDLPSKPYLIERVTDEKKLEVTMKGTVITLFGTHGAILRDDKTVFNFTTDRCIDAVQIGDRVKFNSAYAMGNIQPKARNIKKDKK